MKTTLSLFGIHPITHPMVTPKYLLPPVLVVLCLLSPSSCAGLELLTDGSRGGPGPPPSGSLSVSFIDVGQGDAVLVQAGGESYLIDADGRRRGRTWWISCAAGASIPSTVSWLRIPEVDRTPALGFRALVTEGGDRKVQLHRA